MEDVRAAFIAHDADVFARTISGIGWKPTFWTDEGEACFEWISGDRHAVVSIEGDGSFGYAMRRDGSFVAGRNSDPSLEILPDDLAAYLR